MNSHLLLPLSAYIYIFKELKIELNLKPFLLEKEKQEWRWRIGNYIQLHRSNISKCKAGSSNLFFEEERSLFLDVVQTNGHRHAFFFKKKKIIQNEIERGGVVEYETLRPGRKDVEVDKLEVVDLVSVNVNECGCLAGWEWTQVQNSPTSPFEFWILNSDLKMD